MLTQYHPDLTFRHANELISVQATDMLCGLVEVEGGSFKSPGIQ